MIHLLIVDDQNLVCQGLKTMLDLEEDLKVVGVASNGQSAIAKIATLKPDVVLMDVRMPVMDGREATKIITQKFPEIKVIVLSTFDDDLYIADSIKAGAKGYLLKDMPSEELAQAIRSVNRGYSQMAPGLMEKLVQNVVMEKPKIRKTVCQDLSQLTKREVEILYLVGRGLTNREIAQKLYITEGTVKTHVTHILNRLNFRNRSQIAVYANGSDSKWIEQKAVSEVNSFN
jgi:DNA-binding NarL/FixJ family response regulator